MSMSGTTTIPGLADAERVLADPILRLGNRFGGTPANTIADLGLLASFVGNWAGEGFNLTARPFFQANPPFFLELNATHEKLAFTAIAGDIPNRGSLQPDLLLHGVRYLQEVTDVIANAGIHVEPGLWVHVPALTNPALAENYVRQSTIPHGDSLLAQSSFFTTVSGGPLINPVNAMPFTDTVIPGLNSNPTQPVTDPLYLAQYTNSKLPAFGLLNGLNAAATIKDPTELLRAQIKNQNIIETIVISISTAAPGALVNIPFVQTNAKATQLDAIFWVETVKLPNGEVFLQMQYVQRVILNFIGINWPHISVATLRSI
jgi:hypothetical protein